MTVTLLAETTVDDWQLIEFASRAEAREWEAEHPDVPALEVGQRVVDAIRADLGLQVVTV